MTAAYRPPILVEDNFIGTTAANKRSRLRLHRAERDGHRLRAISGSGSRRSLGSWEAEGAGHMSSAVAGVERE